MASTAALPNSPVLSSARALFTINGIEVGYAGQCSVATSYARTPVDVIGNIEVPQYVPTKVTHQVTFNQLRLVGTNLVTLGFLPSPGNTAEEHLRNLIAIPELTAILEDRITSTVCALLIGVQIESSSLNVSASSLWSEDISGVCRRVIVEGA